MAATTLYFVHPDYLEPPRVFRGLFSLRTTLSMNYLSVFNRSSPCTHALAALACCGALAGLASLFFQAQSSGVDRVKAAVDDVWPSSVGRPELPRMAATQAAQRTPASWPLRSQVDGVVHTANRAAEQHGLTIGSLSMSHQSAAPSAWGQVTLDVVTSGSYEASKAWQAALQQQYPDLALQKLQLNAGAVASTASLDGRWKWVLYVRD